MTSWTNLNLQDPCSISASMLTETHDFLLITMSIILTIVMYIMLSTIANKLTNRNLLSNNTLEIIWTMIPMVMLMVMAIPSIQVLYTLEEDWMPEMTIKVIGHQWYWSYEYPETNKSLDSYMKTPHSPPSFRLLDVDERMIIPMKKFIQILVTSTDVIHSWAIPSLGIKMDAIPGRVNQLTLMAPWPGVHYGQCSEICGTNHSNMPISVESTTQNAFNKWVMESPQESPLAILTAEPEEIPPEALWNKKDLERMMISPLIVNKLFSC